MKKNHLETTTIILYFSLLICFALFAVYISFFEKNTVYSPRDFGARSVVRDDTERVISDPSAPAGIRREFTWVMPDFDANDSCLIFYLVHHYAEVRFDDELVYSLAPGEGNLIGSSPSSNWVIIPLSPSDSGRTVTVTATPAYKSMITHQIEFEIGPRYTILMKHLMADLPQILLSALCILMGILLMAVQIYLIQQKKVRSWELFYLGDFSLLIGVWRVTDTRYSPILFPNNPMALGYITIGTLWLICTPMLLYIKQYYRESEKPLLVTVLVNCAAALAALICQIFGLADFRETLTANHVMLVISLAVLLWTSVRHIRRGAKQEGSRTFVILLAAGVVLDLVYFYLKGTSSNILFTIAALVTYSIYRFISAALKTSRQAYTDAKTGLFNKNRWDELMKSPLYEMGTVGMIMLDLNRLKYTNDTIGHEAGDKMIYNFANILRNTIPPSNTICRWGGDEFTVLITNADREKMERCIGAVADAVAQFNASNEVPKIHYAAGWALSSEFPELSPRELLGKADQRMYLDKRQWYAANRISGDGH